MTITAPCKINLKLRVLGKRPDGFHEIETLMAGIDLADTIEISGAEEGIHLTCSDPSLPAGRDNLVFRAAAMFLERVGERAGVRIHLEKRVPHGAGLGGGSSDAAATLRGLNSLFKSGLDTSTMKEWCGELGSDVPFFVTGGAALCRGRGEIVDAWNEELPGWRMLLVKPPFGVATPDAYRRWQSSDELPGMPYGVQCVDGIDLRNDLERPVFEKFPMLALIKMALLESDGIRAALLSGSGSTLFGILKEGASPDKVIGPLRSLFGETLWTQSVRFSGASLF